MPSGLSQDMVRPMSAPSIIVLEDEPLIALDLEDTLQAAGFQSVTLLASCEDALEHISQHTPSLAIVDLHLKDGTSTDLCRELASRNVPIIVSSVSAQGDARCDVWKRCLAAEANFASRLIELCSESTSGRWFKSKVC
ncbi:response regulator [Rhizobium herbae]